MGSASKAHAWCGKLRVLVLAAGAGLSIAACATAPAAGAGGAAFLASPRYESLGAPRAQTAEGGDRAAGSYKLGAPYQAAGLWFVPAEDPDYDATGVAGAYGDNLQGKPTANGELFDAAAVTGAHATLPMPAIVEVTNLDNGRVLRVRLNDRGAYKSGHVIDLSRGAAEQLGFSPKATAKVRVRYVGPARLDRTTEPLYVQARTPPKPAQPAPAAAPAPLPAPTVASSASAWSSADAADARGSYAIQAGAFSDPARAEQVAMSLARAGAAAVRPVQVSGRQLYRVVVGSWIDQDAADAARAQVAEMGFGDARVIRAF
jgi:rare lipoprotein A